MAQQAALGLVTLNMNDPLDVLYLELIPHRISLPSPRLSDNGPTECFRLLELERAKWALLALFPDDEPEAGAA